MEVSADPARLDRAFIHQYLSSHAPWALGVPRAVMDRAVDHSVCVGAYHDGQQVGFARAVTDQATFAYIDDVFVTDEHRQAGVATRLVMTLLEMEELRHVKSWWLLAEDPHARSLFTGLGFGRPEPERLRRWMALPNRSRGYWQSLDQSDRP